MKRNLFIFFCFSVQLGFGQNFVTQYNGSGFVNCGASISNSVSAANKITVETRFRMTTTPGSWDSPCGTYHSNSWMDGGFGLYYNGSTQKMNFYIFDYSTNNAAASFDPNNTMWHHLAGTWDQNTGVISIYLDGVLAGTDNYTGTIGPITTDIFQIGAANSLYNWRGQLDEVRVWNVVRSQAEIQANMNTQLTGSPTGLVAYYKMEEGTGTSLTDASGNNNSGTMTAGVTWVGAPTVTSFTPVSASTGATVTVNGTNFTGATAVSFGGISATSFSVVNATLITAVVATGASGSVSVTAPGGTASLAGFAYYQNNTWTGLSSSDWNTAGNWSGNTIPTSSDAVTIPNVTNDPVVNQAPASPAVCNNLTIESGGLLTIAAGKALSVNGTLTNTSNAGLVIKSDATNGDGVLINNSSSVAATVELSLTGGSGTYGRIFHYFVPPVGSMSFTNSSISGAATSLGLQAANFAGDLVFYSESAAGSNKNAGWQYFDGNGGTTSFNSLVSSKGYNFYLTAADKMIFTGNLNGGVHSFSSLSYTNLGWNLVGNPYPCNYDLQGITELSSATEDNVDNTVYFTKDGGYAYWNVYSNAGIDWSSDIVSPMQGFFVKVTATGKSLSLPTGSKTTSTAPARAKGASSTESGAIGKIKLALSTGTVSDETIVCLIDKATTGFDGSFDAYKLFGSSTTVPDIYTELGSVKYAINSVQGPVSEPIRIPVSVVIKSPGSYNIDITEFENLDGINVVLKHGAIEIILNKNTSYSFTSAAGTFTDFELIFGGSATGIENPVSEKLKTWYSYNVLYINCPAEILSGKGNLIIYDMQGKPVYSNNLLYMAPGQTIQLPLTLHKGVYMTRVIVNNQPFVSKIVVM